MADGHPRGTLPSITLSGMAHQEEEPGERDGHVPQRPGEEDDPKKDQQESQPLPESLSVCPVGLRNKKGKLLL